MIAMLVRNGLVLVMAVFFSAAVPIHAHTLAPVLITITQLDDTDYQALWSFSRDEVAVNPTVPRLELTPSCQIVIPIALKETDDRWLREERYSCQPLANEPITLRVQGLQLADISVVLRAVDSAKNEQIQLLDQDSSISLFAPSANNYKSPFFNYLVLGGQHILEGVDHLLFVFALCFLVGGATRPLIGLITAFTLAHSITLSAAALGWVDLPGRPVEAMIALSIILVAADLVKKTGSSPIRLLTYWPVVFIFGLLHGLGFAGALSGFGLPENAILTALLAFNLGVEIGQLSLLFVCALIIRIIDKCKEPGWLNPAVGMGIGCTAGFWFISRVV